MLRLPQRGAGKAPALDEGCPAGGNRLRPCGRGSALRIQNARFQDQILPARRVSDLCTDLQGRFPCLRLRGDLNAPQGNMHRIPLQPGDIPDDAAARIPAAVGLLAVVHPDQKVIPPFPQPGRQRDFKRSIAVGMPADPGAVQPEVAVHIHAAEDQGHLPGGWSPVKGFPIPADAGAGISTGAAGGRIPVRRVIHGPVMGQQNRTENVSGLRKGQAVREREFPPLIEQ